MRLFTLISSFVLGALLLRTIPAQAQTLTRGPYVQMVNQTGFTLRWRTSTSTTSRIRYGTDPQSLNLDVNSPNPTTEHELRVTGLQPDTRYYYQVETATDTIAGPHSSHYVKTLPPVGTVRRFHFWAMGDFGDGSVKQRQVLDMLKTHPMGRQPDAWLFLGDNAYGDGTQQQFQDYFFNIYDTLLRNTNFLITPGNHDYGSIDLFNNGPYFDMFTLPRNGECGGTPSGQEGWYSYDIGNVHIATVNSEYRLGLINTSSPMIQWLRNDLRNTTQPWKIVFMHKPPYSKGTHDSDDNGAAISEYAQFRNLVVKTCEDNGVDLFLTGHSHNYERSMLIHGHYGLSSTFNPVTMALDTSMGNDLTGGPYIKYTDEPNANKGCVYVVSGCGGKSGGGSLDHPVHKISLGATTGNLFFDVEDNLLTAWFVRSDGAVIDSFNIVKVSGTTGLADARAASNLLTAQPNPFQNQLDVTLELPTPGRAQLDLLDLTGRVIQTGLLNETLPAGTHRFTLSPTVSTAGHYFLRLSHGGRLWFRKVVKG